MSNIITKTSNPNHLASTVCTQWQLNPSHGIPMTLFYQNSRNCILNLSYLAHSPLDSLYTILSQSSGYLLWYTKDVYILLDFPGGSVGKSVCLWCGRPRFDPWVRKIPWKRKWQFTPVLLPGISHEWTEKPVRLQSMGSQKVKHNLVTSLSYILFILWRKN